MKRAHRVRACAGAVALGLWIVIGGAFCNAQSGGSGRPANSNQTDDNDNNANDNGTVDNGGEDLTAPETLGGTVNVRDFTIPTGHTTRVTSDLVVNASGNVTIDGSLIADASEGAGYSITIDAQGDVDVGGIIQAADAGTATAASGLHAAQQDEGGAVDYSHRGKGGGSIEVKSARRLTIRKTTMLLAGDASHGQDGFADSEGGQGGSIFLSAGEMISLRGSLGLGHGGNGGTVLTTIDDLPEDGIFRNGGGRGGIPHFHAPILDIPGLRSVRSDIHALDAEAYLASTGSWISGSAGGNAGGVWVYGSIPASSAATRTARLMDAAADEDAPDEEQGGDTEGEDVTPPNCSCPEGYACLQAADGGWGCGLGGMGGDITINVGFDLDGFDGNPWAGIAGNGGDVDEVWLIPGVVEVFILDKAKGGEGGSANVGVSSGENGNDAHPAGGRGGSAYACGGRGGSGCLYGDQIGGNGGDAIVYPGAGGGGNTDPCLPGNGGAGGDALAYGGYGGNGSTPGLWGEANANLLYGRGGSGGTGSAEAGAGAGGLGGRVYRHNGCTGRSDPDDSAPEDCGTITDERAENGEPGSGIGCCSCEGWRTFER